MKEEEERQINKGNELVDTVTFNFWYTNGAKRFKHQSHTTLSSDFDVMVSFFHSFFSVFAMKQEEEKKT